MQGSGGEFSPAEKPLSHVLALNKLHDNVDVFRVLKRAKKVDEPHAVAPRESITFVVSLRAAESGSCCAVKTAVADCISPRLHVVLVEEVGLLDLLQCIDLFRSLSLNQVNDSEGPLAEDSERGEVLYKAYTWALGSKL